MSSPIPQSIHTLKKKKKKSLEVWSEAGQAPPRASSLSPSAVPGDRSAEAVIGLVVAATFLAIPGVSTVNTWFRRQSFKCLGLSRPGRSPHNYEQRPKIGKEGHERPGSAHGSSSDVSSMFLCCFCCWESQALPKPTILSFGGTRRIFSSLCLTRLCFLLLSTPSHQIHQISAVNLHTSSCDPLHPPRTHVLLTCHL